MTTVNYFPSEFILTNTREKFIPLWLEQIFATKSFTKSWVYISLLLPAVATLTLLQSRRNYLHFLFLFSLAFYSSFYKRKKYYKCDTSHGVSVISDNLLKSEQIYELYYMWVTSHEKFKYVNYIIWVEQIFQLLVHLKNR